MCDVLGPPQLVCAFQRYDVYRNRSFIYVFGIDKVNKQYSCLQIPRKDEPSAVLELQEGEQRFPLTHLEPHQQKLRGPQHQVEEVATKASGLVGFIRFTSGFYLILIKKHKKAVKTCEEKLYPEICQMTWQVGRIGHHNILSIESTILVPLSADASKEEKGFMDQFNKFNLCKDTCSTAHA
eukprot:symbB.v1.2.025016.t1/scaffold2407.1/size80004/2